MLRASIIIPSYGRPEALKRCFTSLRAQTLQPYEIILRREKGPLASIRNAGARQARGGALIFIDDDVFTTSGWLSSLVGTLESDETIGGVSGPSIITKEYRTQRDLFRYGWIKKLYDSLFLEGRQYLPGHFMRSGAWTTGACEENCNYSGEVQFLEACNMGFKKEAFESVGGFDESFGGIGDWSEPDLAFRIRQRGYKLLFNPEARLYHEPSQNGAYHKRKSDSHQRMENYLLFSKRWIHPSWRHSLYKAFMRTYYAIETFKR